MATTCVEAKTRAVAAAPPAAAAAAALAVPEDKAPQVFEPTLRLDPVNSSDDSSGNDVKTLPRRPRFAEIFSGSAHLAQAFAKCDHVSEAWDYVDGPSSDFLDDKVVNDFIKAVKLKKYFAVSFAKLLVAPLCLKQLLSFLESSH